MYCVPVFKYDLSKISTKTLSLTFLILKVGFFSLSLKKKEAFGIPNPCA